MATGFLFIALIIFVIVALGCAGIAIYFSRKNKAGLFAGMISGKATLCHIFTDKYHIMLTINKGP